MFAQQYPFTSPLRSSCARVARTLFALTALATLAALPALASPLPVTYNGAQSGVNFGSVAVASTNTVPVALSFTITNGTTLGPVSILTEGVAGKDFADAGGSTCIAQTYGDATCVVNVTVSPHVPGPRPGAVVLSDPSGNVLATVPLFVTGTGPQTVYSQPVQTTYTTGLNNMGQIVVDANSNAYIASNSVPGIVKISNTGVQSTISFSSENIFSRALAMDGAGNFYAPSFSGTIYQITPAGVATPYVTLTGGMHEIEALAFDAQGNLYIADEFAGGLIKVTPSGTMTTVGSLSQVYGIASDAASNIYVADAGNEAVYEITSAGVQTTIVSSSTLGQAFRPSGVAIDASGIIYVANSTSGNGGELASGVYTLSLDGTMTPVASTNWDTPSSIALDPGGDLLVSDGDFNATRIGTVVKLNRSDEQTLTFTTPTNGGASDTAENPKSLAVVNIGNMPLAFSSVVYPLDFPEDASGETDCTSSTTLVKSASCTFTFDFTPQAAQGSSTTVGLVEALKFTTNRLNMTDSLQRVVTSGTALKRTSTLVLSVDNPTPLAGSDYTITAVASGAGATPTGTVTFKSGTQVIGTSPLAGGVATLPGALVAGSRTVTASYSGDAVYIPSTASGLVITVGKATPTITLTSSQSPVSIGTSVTFTATVTSPFSGLTATGTVEFYSNWILIGTGSLSDGQATIITSSLPGGPRPIFAIYRGNSQFVPVTSATFTETVNKYSANVSLSLNPTAPNVGVPVTFTALVTQVGDGPAVTGTVHFYSGGVLIGSSAVVSGVATFTTGLTPGLRTNTATYAGDGNYLAATSNAVKLTVTKYSATVSLSEAPASVPVGSPIAFTAQVTPIGEGPAVTGTVRFYSDGVLIGSGTIVGGVATFSSSSLTAGKHTITAVYGADGNYLSANSNSVRATITN